MRGPFLPFLFPQTLNNHARNWCYILKLTKRYFHNLECFKLLQYTVLCLLVASSQTALTSDCLAASVSDSWTLNGIEHSLSGRTVSGDRYDACYVQAKAVVDAGDISQPAEVKDKSFCLISYYYDRAVETKLIGSSFIALYRRPYYYDRAVETKLIGSHSVFTDPILCCAQCLDGF